MTLDLSKSEQERVALLQRRITRYNTAREAFHNPHTGLWHRSLRNYQARLSEVEDWISDVPLFLPLSTQNVHVGQARLASFVPSPRPRARNPINDRYADYVKAYLDWCMELCAMNYRMIHFSKAIKIYGTAVAFVGWKVDKRKVKRWVPMMMNTPNGFQPMMDQRGRPVRSQAEVTETDYDGPTFDYVHIGDAWFPPFYAGVNRFDSVDGRKMPDCVMRVNTTVRELKRLQSLGTPFKYLEECKGTIATMANSSDMSLKNLYEAFHIEAEDNYVDDAEDSPCSLYYFFERDHWTILYELIIPIYDGDNPFQDGNLPLVMYRDNEIPGLLYGLPDLFFIEGMQYGVNAIASLGLEHVDLSTSPPLVYDSNSIGTKELIWGPRAAIGANLSGKSVKEIADFIGPKELGNTPLVMFNMMKGAIEETTGTSAMQLGVAGGAKLATEVALANSYATNKARLDGIRLMQTIFLPTYHLWVERARQFMDNENLIRLNGQGGNEFGMALMAPEVFDLNWDFSFDEPGKLPGEVSAEERLRYQEILTLLAQNPIFAPYFDMQKLLDRVLRTAYGDIQPERILKTPEQMQADVRAQNARNFLAMAGEAGTAGAIAKGQGQPVSLEPDQSNTKEVFGVARRSLGMYGGA